MSRAARYTSRVEKEKKKFVPNSETATKPNQTRTKFYVENEREQNTVDFDWWFAIIGPYFAANCACLFFFVYGDFRRFYE